MVEEVVVREEEVERLSFFFATVEADDDRDDERKGKKVACGRWSFSSSWNASCSNFTRKDEA